MHMHTYVQWINTYEYFCNNTVDNKIVIKLKMSFVLYFKFIYLFYLLFLFLFTCIFTPFWNNSMKIKQTKLNRILWQTADILVVDCWLALKFIKKKKKKKQNTDDTVSNSALNKPVAVTCNILRLLVCCS